MTAEMTKRISTLASVLGLGALLVFTGCVKQHKDRVDTPTDQVFALDESVPLTVNLDGEAPTLLNQQSMYSVQDDYVGCSPSDLAVGALTNGDKVVVTLSSGKNAACVKPASLAKMSERPPVTFFKKPGVTEYYIQTREVVRQSGRTEAPEGVKVNGEIGVRMLDVVDYTTNSPILSQVRDLVELRALPGEKYKVYHKITPHVLYVMKVSTKDRLSHLDLPIADNLGNGEYAVPIAAVPIELLKYSVIRNGDNEKTNRYRYEPVNDLRKGSYIRFNVRNIKEVDLPDSIAKDLYPADYFTKGQWYFSESVVDTRPGSEGLIGTSTGAFDTEFRAASKVQFTRASSSLIACNVGVDERYAEDYLCRESASVLTVPATGHAFELSPTSTDVAEVRILSSQAPFIKLDLNSVSSIRKSIDELFSIVRDTNSDQLLNLNFSEDKFSFIVQRGANGRRVMYSFLRADNRTPYTTRRHYKDDRQNKFGYFVQTVNKIRSSDIIEREEDLERDYLVQRHNPDKDIVFHFSNLTPDYVNGPGGDPYGLEIDYRKIGENSIEYWAKAYERAGAPNSVVLGEGEAPFGDIAFNTMNLIDSERGSNLLGVGPSLVDPYTGEVINANANVYIAPFREIIARQVRNYIKAKTGLLDDVTKQLPSGAVVNSTLLGDMSASTIGIKDVLATVVPENIMTMVANFYHHGVSNFTSEKINVDEYGANSGEVADLYTLTKFNSQNSMVQNLVKVAQRVPEMVALRDLGEVTFEPRSRKDLLNLQKALEAQRPTFYRAYFMSDSAMGSEYNSLTGQIEEECGEVLKLVSFVNNRANGENAPARLTTEEELPALRHCMTEVIPGKFQATLIHEIGHTLGLRHNFYASADKENFFKASEVEELYGLQLQEHELPKSSSVMDYVRTEQDRLTYPGHYDIAAIRYGYANAVEVASPVERPNTKQGVYVKLVNATSNNPEGSIDDELSGVELRPFAYCTDVEASLEIDPMCARHDFGTNPQMIVNDSINSFWESFTLYNFRYDRLGPGVGGPFRRAARMDKLKRIYTEWRVHLANHLGKDDSTGNTYLQRYDRAQYDQLLGELRNDPNFKGKEYLAVRDQIFDFVLDVAFFPNKYCLASTPVGPKAFEFDKLRDELKNQLPKGTKVSSCGHPEMVSLIEGKGYTYLYEAGLPVDNLWYAVNPQDTFEESVNFRSFRAPLDVVGSFLDRYFASTFLGGRNAGYTGLLEKMFPNMMDEPDLYERFEQRMVARMTQGVDLRGTFINVIQKDIEAEDDTVKKAELTDKLNKIAQDLVVTNEQGQRFVRSLPNYDSESALLKALWLSLEQGIRNQFVDNSRKLSKYTRQITNEQSIIEDAQENGGFVMPLTTGDALVVRPEASVAFALAQGLINVTQTFQAANQQVPTVEQLTESLANLPVQLSEVLKLGESSTAITAEQYYEFVQIILSAFGQVDPLQQSVIQSVYINDVIIYFEEIAPAEQQGPEAVAAKLAEINAKGWTVVAAKVRRSVGPQQPVSVPSAESVVTSYNTIAPEAGKQIVEQATQARDQRRAVLDVHGDELFAQYELLRSVLTYDFSQVQTDFQLRLVELTGDMSEDSFARLSLNSRSDIRDFANKYLSPKVIAQEKWGLEFKFDNFLKEREAK